MKPENRAAGELTSAEGASNKVVELTEDEKAVINLLKANSPIDLDELKGQTGLSNKKWDKAIKGLTKNKLARVEKTDEGLIVTRFNRSKELLANLHPGLVRNCGSAMPILLRHNKGANNLVLSHLCH